MKIKKIVLNDAEAKAITTVIEHGNTIADVIYPFIQPIYDEDAGVFTDYGCNDTNCTWAGIHFRNLLSNVVFATIRSGDNVEFKLFDIGIPALVQGLHRFYSDKDLQYACSQRTAVDLWESDGHYGSQTRVEFIKEHLDRVAIDRKLGRNLCEKLNFL
jgi:hypothetical protein